MLLGLSTVGVTSFMASELILNTEKQTESQMYAVCSWIMDEPELV